jgi:hypothetical protein
VPRFQCVDDRSQQLTRVAGQVQQSVGIELGVGELAILKLQHGAMSGTPIAAQQAQHVDGAQLGQVMPEQHDLWLRDFGNP